MRSHSTPNVENLAVFLAVFSRGKYQYKQLCSAIGKENLSYSSVINTASFDAFSHFHDILLLGKFKYSLALLKFVTHDSIMISDDNITERVDYNRKVLFLLSSTSIFSFRENSSNLTFAVKVKV